MNSHTAVSEAVVEDRMAVALINKLRSAIPEEFTLAMMGEDRKPSMISPEVTMLHVVDSERQEVISIGNEVLSPDVWQHLCEVCEAYSFTWLAEHLVRIDLSYSGSCGWKLKLIAAYTGDSMVFECKERDNNA